MSDLLWMVEINITLFFQGLGEWLKVPLSAFTFLGNESFYIIVMPAIYWCIDSIIGLRMAIMLVLSGGLNACFKFLFHSPRPIWFDSRVKALSSETSFGLPSGHSQNAVSLWGTLAVSLKKKIITILVIIIIFFIGISRIYLGVHFTRDVLLGWTIGLILLWGYFKLEKPVARWISKKTLLIQIMYIFLFCMILVALGCASLYSLTNWQLPNAWIETALLNGAEEPDPLNFEGVVTFAGVAFGFLSGFAWWVKKYGVPKIQGSFLKRFLRYLVGIIGVVIFYIGLKYVFPEDPLWLGFILRFARYGIIGLWVSAIAPIIFRKIKLSE